MTKARKSHTSAQYRIKLKERLGDKWSDWFEQIAISTEGGQTILTGSFRSIEFYLRNRTDDGGCGLRQMVRNMKV